MQASMQAFVAWRTENSAKKTFLFTPLLPSYPSQPPAKEVASWEGYEAFFICFLSSSHRLFIANGGTFRPIIHDITVGIGGEVAAIAIPFADISSETALPFL